MPIDQPVEGCNGLGKLEGSFVSGQGISKSLFIVSEKSGNFI